MKAVILAGGKGVRLRPLTYTIPKPLLPVGEKPILEVIIEKLKRQGITALIVAVGYRAELIETYFRDGSQLGVSIEYVRETHPLGTAGPLALVRRLCSLPDGEAIVVINGDVLTELDLGAFVAYHARQGFALTVATRQYQLQHPYGVIRLDGGRVTQVVEKPTETDTISAGIYALDPSTLDAIPFDTLFDMPDLVNKLVADGRAVGAYDFSDEWISIDGIEQLEDAGRMLAERTP